MVHVISGPIMATFTMVNIKIKGKGGHASLPYMTNDVISAGTALILSLNTIKSRLIHNKENFVFTICSFKSGYCDSVIPEEATLQGSIRSFNDETLKEIEKHIRNITKEIMESYECSAEVEI